MENNAERIVLDCLSEITGLENEELKEIRAINLFENDILDSLSFVNLLTHLEEMCNTHIDFSLFKPKNLTTIDELIAMVAAL